MGLLSLRLLSYSSCLFGISRCRFGRGCIVSWSILHGLRFLLFLFSSCWLLSLDFFSLLFIGLSGLFLLGWLTFHFIGFFQSVFFVGESIKEVVVYLEYFLLLLCLRLSTFLLLQ